ncbi:unnamed protein product [Absidia cylindrospora]
MSTASNSPKARVFEPVILFHDHSYYKEGSNHLEHTHIPYNDPHHISLIENHKQKIQRMLDINGKLWIDQSQDDTMTLPSSVDLFLLPLQPAVPSDQPPPSNSVLSPALSPIPTTIMSTPLPSSLYSPQHTTMNTTRPQQQRRRSVTTNEHHRNRTPSFNGSVLSTSSSTNTSTSISTSISGHRKRRGNLPKAVTTVLRDWLADHKLHPYPTDEEKLYLSQQTNLTLNQVSNWFINARRRILIPMLEEDTTSSPLTASY